jgi:hypothetical protein
VPDHNLLARLALREHEQNKALGVSRVTSRTEALLLACNKQFADMAQVVMGGHVLFGLLNGHIKHFKKLYEEGQVEDLDPDRRGEILTQAQELYDQCEKIVAAMERMEDGV